MCTSLIIWNFICITFIFYGKSICQDASLTIMTMTNYQQEKLKFGCSPTQPSAWSSLSHVTLSKNTSASTSQDIVTLILQTSPTIQNKTTWVTGAGNWQSRAQIIKQYVQPVAGSGIEFDILPEQVLCSDEGTYNCKISGQNTATQFIERTQSGTLSFIVNPTMINKIQKSPFQTENIYNAGSSVKLTCSGTVGRPAGDLTWCYRRPNELSFNGWPSAADIYQGAPVPNGCQNFRTSTLAYNVSAGYEYLEFKCVTGSTSCNSFDGLSANITIYRYTAMEPMSSGDDNRFVALGAGLSTVLLLSLVVNVVFIFMLINARKFSSKDSARSTANTEVFYIIPEDQGSSYETLGARDLPNVYSQVQQTR